MQYDWCNLRHQLLRESPKRMIRYSTKTVHSVAFKVSQQASQMRMLRNSILNYHLTQNQYSLSTTTPQHFIFEMTFSDSSHDHFIKLLEDLPQPMAQVLQSKKALYKNQSIWWWGENTLIFARGMHLSSRFPSQFIVNKTISWEVLGCIWKSRWKD